MSELRQWLHEWSAARRAARARAAIYGETIRITATVPTHEFVAIISTPGSTKPPPRAKKRPSVVSHVPPTREQVIRSARNQRIVRLQRKRQRLIEAQGRLCYLCLDPFTADDPATLEHVRPRASGGQTADNVLAAHFSCNQKKADRPATPQELAYLRKINLLLGCAPDDPEAKAVYPPTLHLVA